MAGNEAAGKTELTPRLGKVASRELALNGYTRYEQLTAATRQQLLDIHGVGPKAIHILEEELRGRGLSFLALDGSASTDRALPRKHNEGGPGGELTIDQIMTILPQTVPSLAALTNDVSPAALHAPPKPGEWSVNDVLAHLRACSDVLGGNIVRIMTEDTPAVKALSPRTHMRRTDYPAWQFEPAFEAFNRQRSELLAVVQPLPTTAWERTAMVSGLVGGPAPRSAHYYGDWMAGHERAHVKHIARIVAHVRDHSANFRAKGR